MLSYIGTTRYGVFEQNSVGTGDVRGATPLWVAAKSSNGGGLTARGKSPAAFERRYITPDGVARRSHIVEYARSSRLVSRAPRRSRCDAGFHHGLLKGEQGPPAQYRYDSSADIIRALVAAGADPNLATDDGTTPLMMAAGLGVRSHQPLMPRGRPSPPAEEAVRALLDRYCVTCHNERLQTANLMLDSTLFLYGTGISDSNTHFHEDLPIALIGGKATGITGGRYVRYPEGTPLANLHMTVLEMLGTPVESFGDSTGTLKRLSV